MPAVWAVPANRSGGGALLLPAFGHFRDDFGDKCVQIARIPRSYDPLTGGHRRILPCGACIDNAVSNRRPPPIFVAPTGSARALFL
jgi:hypothetical protein